MERDKRKENLSLAFTFLGITLLTFFPLLVIGQKNLILIYLIFSAMAVFIGPHIYFVNFLTYLYATIKTTTMPFRWYFVVLYILFVVEIVMLILTIRELQPFKKHP